MPIDIDTHTIPANDVRGEPEHSHYDMRWLFGVPATQKITLQPEEVTGYDWLGLEHIEPKALRDKLQQRLSCVPLPVPGG